MKLTTKNLFIGMSVVLGLGCGLSMGHAQIIPLPSSPATGAGNLEPPSSAVDGSGNPTETTSTQPSWDQRLRADNGDANGCHSTRFKCIWSAPPLNTTGVAVLDKESGLVWERFPENSGRDWDNARRYCARQSTGGRWGWRLPSVHELSSLLDRGSQFNNLPVGSPWGFLNGLYWSATTDVNDVTRAWNVIFQQGGIVGSDSKSQSDRRAWCVRGGGPLVEY